MNKIIITFMLLMMPLVICAQSQTGITGIVCDKDGNPLPGVRIKDRKSNDISTTDINGVYSIPSSLSSSKLIFSHKGMESVSTIPEEGNPIILKKKASLVPEHYSWFIMPQISFLGEDVRIGTMSYGLMFGVVRRVGFYVQTSFNPTWSIHCDDSIFEYFFSPCPNFWVKHFDVGAGVICRLWSPVHFYAGGSYVTESLYLQCYSSDCYHKEPRNTGSSIGLDAGLMLKLNHFMIGFGMQLHGDLGYYATLSCNTFVQETSCDLKLEIGYSF